MSKLKIIVIHGPNLDMLGKREPHIYGTTTLDEINLKLKEIALKENVLLDVMQSNHEGEIIDKINKTPDKSAILINPGAYTHTSIAIRDSLAGANVPAIEVHLSNTYKREPFRKNSLIADVVNGRIIGLGVNSYIFGLKALIEILKNDEGR